MQESWITHTDGETIASENGLAICHLSSMQFATCKFAHMQFAIRAAIALLGRYPREMKTEVLNPKSYTKVCTVVLLMSPQSWKLP